MSQRGVWVTLMLVVAFQALADDHDAKRARPFVPTCFELYGRRMCTMEYMPSSCTADVKKEKVTGSGSNACFATLSVQMQACEKGLSYAEVEKLDVRCQPSEEFLPRLSK